LILGGTHAPPLNDPADPSGGPGVIDSGVSGLQISRTWFHNGLILGPQGNLSVVTAAAAAKTAGSPGDIVFNTDPVEGGPAGWINVGFPNNWRAFGQVGETDQSPSADRSTFSTFFPGPFTSVWDGARWTPDRPITVTRMSASSKNPVAGCSAFAVVEVTDGPNSVSLTLNAQHVEAAFAQTYKAGVPLAVRIVVASNCASPPADVNLLVQYKTAF
jgi:hypothetical protein